MTRTAVFFSKLLDPNLVFQIYFFLIYKSAIEFPKNSQNNILND